MKSVIVINVYVVEALEWTTHRLQRRSDTPAKFCAKRKTAEKVQLQSTQQFNNQTSN